MLLTEAFRQAAIKTDIVQGKMTDQANDKECHYQNVINGP